MIQFYTLCDNIDSCVNVRKFHIFQICWYSNQYNNLKRFSTDKMYSNYVCQQVTKFNKQIEWNFAQGKVATIP